ncbi:MAG: SMC family ATPase, partial [Actinobacteria bacterium]|nr:SMC family ATPase [Actinomycetota bacterium]
AAAQAAELAAAVSAAREEQGAVDGQTLAAEKELAARSGRLTTARDGLARLRSRLAAAAGDHPSVAARQAALRESASHHRSVAAALDRLADAVASQEKSRARAEREASGRGFASLAEAQAAALDPAGLADLEAQVMSWQDTLAGLTGAARDPGLADLDPAAAGRVRQAAEQAAEELAEAAEAEAAARRERDGAAYRADRFGACLADVHQAEEDHERLTERTEAVIRLAGLAKGTEGHRRVALTTYVLRHWFGQVVAAANLRLGAMSAGRYELVRTDQAESKRARSGLTLAVIDRHTGEERSPASLSGGETFYTSLALALGLADVVRAEAGGVDLDTLFIDEGFGSLDAGTLDQVMAVIDDLRERGRAVGIVSHVADLKDRVPERLEIRRLPDGSSEVRVVA